MGQVEGAGSMHEQAGGEEGMERAGREGVKVMACCMLKKRKKKHGEGMQAAGRQAGSKAGKSCCAKSKQAKMCACAT